MPEAGPLCALEFVSPGLTKGTESNRVQTGEDFFLIFRLYGHGKSVLEQTWKLNDVEQG